MSESRFYHVPRTGKLIRMKSPGAALLAAKRGGFAWLHYSPPEKDELLPLVKALKLHPLAIEDCLDDDQIPKVEDFPGNTFFLFNAVDYSGARLSIGEIDLFLGKNFLVTVSQRKGDGSGFLDGVEHVVESDFEGARQGPAYLMHVILDHVVDRKFAAVEAIEEELDGIEETMLSDVSSFKPAELLRLRRSLLNLRKSLFHEREILVKICRKDCPFIPENAIFHFRDIYDHLAKFFELTESYRDWVTSLMEMYLSLLNNRMTKASNDTNVIVRRLTMITTIFMPLSLLAGIGGMSEWSMMTGPENWKIAYPVFLGAMALIGFVNYLFLKRLEKKGRRNDRKKELS